MIDWENLTDEENLNMEYENLSLEDRISRLQFCAKRLDKLHDELSSLGIGNLPFDGNPADYYDKDVDANLDILVGLCKLQNIALARAEELSNLTKHAG